MKKTPLPRLFWAGFLFALILGSCGTSEAAAVVSEAESSSVMDTSPREGKLVFLGVAGIRSKLRDSIDLALEEAARRVAIFTQVAGAYSAWSITGARLFDYRAEVVSALYYDPDYRAYVDDLEFNEESDVFISENAVFVRVRYPGSLNLPYRSSVSGPGGKPSWIDNPPARIGEYAAGVGYAGRRDAHRDTVTASYENAVFAIIRTFHSISWGQNLDYRGAGFFDIFYSSRLGLEAKGILSGFYALETWTDPADKSVWTLAVAKDKAK